MKIMKNRSLKFVALLVAALSMAAISVHKPKMSHLTATGSLVFGTVPPSEPARILTITGSGGIFSAGKLRFAGDTNSFVISAFNGDAELFPLNKKVDYTWAMPATGSRTFAFKPVYTSGTPKSMSIQVLNADGAVEQTVTASVTVNACTPQVYYVICDCDADSEVNTYQTVNTCSPQDINIDPFATGLNCNSAAYTSACSLIQPSTVCAPDPSSTCYLGTSPPSSSDCNAADPTNIWCI